MISGLVSSWLETGRVVNIYLQGLYIIRDFRDEHNPLLYIILVEETNRIRYYI